VIIVLDLLLGSLAVAHRDYLMHLATTHPLPIFLITGSMIVAMTVIPSKILFGKKRDEN